MCALLAGAGFTVRAVATTGSEQTGGLDVREHLRGLGVASRIDRSRARPEISFDFRGVGYRLLDVGRHRLPDWERVLGAQFDRLFDDELRSFRPDCLLTFGGSPGDVHRWKRARRQGARVVFSLRNEGYLQRGFFDGVDSVLTPSQYLSDRYRDAIGLDSSPLPTPIELEDVIAVEREPIFFTMVNPSHEKGLMVVARLAEELSLRRPDIAMLVIESRGSGGLLVQAGLADGFDLRRHENLMMAPAVPRPRDLYGPAKVLLVPSLRDSAPRVVPEALLNGVPPIASDRGGLPELCREAGFVLPLPPEIDLSLRAPVAREVVTPWVDLIERLEDDAAFYRQASEAALRAAERYQPEKLRAEYAAYFLAGIS
jgi:glycosyltransferase involved in cell wall biosynthesis